MKRLAALCALVGLGLGSLVGCSDDKTYAVVNVTMKDGELPMVNQFVANVINGLRRDVLYYPVLPGGPWRISTTEKVNFSISFKSSYVGFLKVGVEARDRLGTVFGYGEAEKMIDPGHRFDLDVAIVLGAVAPALGSDAGAGADVADATAIKLCDPLMATACGTNKTCIVDCNSTPPVGVCRTSGFGKDGATCRSEVDCEPGSQCFEYKDCGIKVCRRFCGSDTDCPTGRCNRTVSCGAQVTSNKFCSQNCDPTGDGVGGCTNGLKCLLFANETASCDCGGGTRVKKDGEGCETTASCLPGLICIGMGGPTVCRPLCKLADKVCPAGTTCTELLNPKYSTYGACLPPAP
jgi:hypothetical protein